MNKFSSRTDTDIFSWLVSHLCIKLGAVRYVDTLEESNKHKFQNSSAFSVRQTYNIMQVVFSIGMANSNIVSKEYVP